MAKQHLLIGVFILFQACTHAAVVPEANNPNEIRSGEGIMTGQYIHPLALSRPMALPSVKTVKMLFSELESPLEIEIKTGTDGTFAFKAPAGKYVLKRIKSSPGQEETGLDGLQFTITAGKTTAIGSLYSSCDPWNENSETTARFQKLVRHDPPLSYRTYGDESKDCLVFLEKGRDN